MCCSPSPMQSSRPSVFHSRAIPHDCGHRQKGDRQSGNQDSFRHYSRRGPRIIDVLTRDDVELLILHPNAFSQDTSRPTENAVILHPNAFSQDTSRPYGKRIKVLLPRLHINVLLSQPALQEVFTLVPGVFIHDPRILSTCQWKEQFSSATICT